MPLLPVKISESKFNPLHTDTVAGVIIPPTVELVTVKMAILEYAAVQGLLCTKALYQLVNTIFKYACVTVTLAIFVQVNPLFVETSQRVTLPTFPESVNTPLLFPLQTDNGEGVMVPPTVNGFTVIVAIVEKSGVQFPLCTNARYFVVTTRLR